jgi:hypothetical protein
VRVRGDLVAVGLTAAVAMTSCGGGSPAAESQPTSSPTSPVASAEATASESAAAPPATEAVEGTAAHVDVLGAPSPFAPARDGEPMEVSVSGRECVLVEPLFGSCRAATGAGGAFVVTAEGVADSPGEWTVVARCGLAPAAPGAAASGAFAPVLADVGLAPYGDGAAVTLLGTDHAEAALVYQPAGAPCPVVWGLGQVSRTSLFTGGTDALNGDEDPLRFLDATGAEACAVADGNGGIRVGAPDGADCRS